MSDVDHRGMCRFSSPSHPGYCQIENFLLNLEKRILELDESGIASRLHLEKPWSDQVADKDTGDDISKLKNDLQVADLIRNHVADTRGQENVGGEDKGRRSIRAGEGEGGSIVRNANGLIIGGGWASGASMSLSDLRDFRGTVEGGIGRGATVYM